MKDYEKTELWHIIEGEWVKIIQIQSGNIVEFYTNGLREGSAKLKKDGTYKEKSFKK